MTEINQNKLIVGILFSVETIEGVNFFFQNFFKDNGGIFIFESEEYQYLPINYNPPERNINLDNFETQITIPAIPLIINLLDSYNYFIDAIVQAKIILDGFPSLPLIADDKGIISSYSIRDAESGEGAVSLVIQAPDSAVSSSFPNITYFTGQSKEALNLTGFLPVVPLSNNVRIR